MSTSQQQPPPERTVREILGMMRKLQSSETNTHIAWHDFLELTPAEQIEFLFRGLIETTKMAETAVRHLQARP
jgi:hypothetical protein